MPDLERILEEYLVADLLALKETRVGFPVLMTAFAGVELLGSILGHGQHGTDGDDFRFYWTQYLYPERTRPRTKEEADIIYTFVRHGVMHHFFPKGTIGVTGNDPGGHLTCRSDGVLILDVRVLVDDFVRVYEQRVKPILATPSGTPSRASMQKRLDEIRDAGLRGLDRLHRVFDLPATQRPQYLAVTAATSQAVRPSDRGPSGLF
jgi:hypothetical protein